MGLGSLGIILVLFASAVQGMVWLTGYIGGNAFPNPLSEQDEQLALVRLADGDLNARRLLIEHNLRLVAHVVKKYTRKGEEQDDLISIGSIGLIKGIDTFNPAKGVRLATYCARCIENELLMTTGCGRNYLVTNKEGTGAGKRVFCFAGAYPWGFCGNRQKNRNKLETLVPQ